MERNELERTEWMNCFRKEKSDVSTCSRLFPRKLLFSIGMFSTPIFLFLLGTLCGPLRGREKVERFIGGRVQ